MISHALGIQGLGISNLENALLKGNMLADHFRLGNWLMQDKKLARILNTCSRDFVSFGEDHRTVNSNITSVVASSVDLYYMHLSTVPISLQFTLLPNPMRSRIQVLLLVRSKRSLAWLSFAGLLIWEGEA